MGSVFNIVGYKLTDDPDFMDRQNHMTPYLKDVIQELYYDVHKGKRSVIPVILKLIDRFPNNPQLKNFLSVAYNNLGEIEKSEEVNRWILKEHPDYLFGILNKAASFFYRKEFYKIPQLLGKNMELKELYPHRDIFHVGEFISFTKFTIQYFFEIGNIDAAKSRLDLLIELFPDHPDTESVKEWYKTHLEEKGTARTEKKTVQKNTVVTKPFSKPQTTENPVFSHHEIYSLYEFDLNIPHLFLEDILLLPRKSVIADLQLMINDGISRYRYFEELYGREIISEERLSFPLHAILLLGELRAKESLSTVLDFLSLDSNFLIFWLGDHKTETLYEPIYYLGESQLNLLKDFMFKSNVDTYVKTSVLSAVQQVYFYQPHRKNEVIGWYSDVLEFFIEHVDDDHLNDSDLLAFIISDIINIREKRLLPRIEKLFESTFISEEICGTLQEVIAAFDKSGEGFDNKKDLLNIQNRYMGFTGTFLAKNHGVVDENKAKVHLKFRPEFHLRTGKNDPCPCGSGRKFMDCCMNRLN